MSLSPGAKLGRYEIRSKLGEGGMGEVYLAQDTKLDRKVALKILPAQVASNRDRMERFAREAKSAAALNHPNIATIHEIGESDGINFIAMEFIDGQTLRELIHKQQLNLARLLRHLQHVAEGLAKAHSAGFVHRGLKPDNIMVTRDGHAKILDFGLAKLIEGRGDRETRGHGEEGETLIAASPRPPVPASITSPGLIMGTVGYMSPEQAEGKTKEIDQRSDIFSFGCLIYEAATGKKPFEGDSVVKSLHMVIYEPAPPIADFNPSAPPELQRILRRCLAKDPEDRYQTIKDVATELKELRREMQAGTGIDTTTPPPTRVGVPPSDAISSSHNSEPKAGVPGTQVSSAEYIVTGIKHHKLLAAIVVLVVVAAGTGVYLFLHGRNSEVAIDSIAVLPFVNQSQSNDTDYLSDGLTESIINKLIQFPALRVTPRSTVFHYKSKDLDPLKIGKELGVRAVLTGRLLQRGDNLMVSAELLDVRDNKQIWGEQYNRKLADALTVQQEISREITDRLSLKLSGDEEKQMRRRDTTSGESYQSYLRGRYYW